MSKKPVSKKTAKAVVKPPRVAPRQPKLKNRKPKKPRVNGPIADSPAALELGPRLMPTPDLALEVLEEASRLNDSALQLEAIYKAKATAAKEAREAWKTKVEEIQRHLRLSTHESTLPLLAESEHDADVERMEKAIESGGEL